jgi:hypothetical protein
MTNRDVADLYDRGKSGHKGCGAPVTVRRDIEVKAPQMGRIVGPATAAVSVTLKGHQCLDLHTKRV